MSSRAGRVDTGLDQTETFRQLAGLLLLMAQPRPAGNVAFRLLQKITTAAMGRGADVATPLLTQCGLPLKSRIRMSPNLLAGPHWVIRLNVSGCLSLALSSAWPAKLGRDAKPAMRLLPGLAACSPRMSAAGPCCSAGAILR